jgi:hypothetical protein
MGGGIMAEKTYTLKATNTECRFDTDELDLSVGYHRFVVKAKAHGFIDSEYSNEVSVNVAVASGFTLTIEHDFVQNCDLYINGDLVKSRGNDLSGTYENVKTFSLEPQGMVDISYTEDDYSNDERETIWEDGEDNTWTLTNDLTIYALWQK